MIKDTTTLNFAFMFRLTLVVLCFFLISCSTTKVNQIEKADDRDWDEEMANHGVFVLFDTEHFYVFDLYTIPVYDKKIPFDYYNRHDVKLIEILNPNSNDARIAKLGIDSRRKVIFMELETIAEDLKNSPYMTKFLKTAILE